MLRRLCYLAALLVPSAYAQAPDVTSRLEALGDPMQGFYADPNAKGTLYDLQAFDGKIYVGHGSTNSPDPSLLIHFDPARGRFDADRNTDGTYVAIAEEGLNPLRVYDGELHLGSMDPNGGGTNFTRKRNGRWASMSVAPDAHNRDLYKFGGEYFMHHGRSAATYPSVLISSDDGVSFRAPTQPNVSTASVAYAKFFEFKGQLYFTQIAEPYLSRYTGNTSAPFEVAATRRSDFVLGSTSSLVMEDAMEIGGRLVFNSGGLYSASSLTTFGVAPVVVPGLTGFATANIIKHDGTVYVLMYQGSTYAVASTTDGVTFREAFRFTSASSLSKFEVLGDDFYFGGRRSLLRVQMAEALPVEFTAFDALADGPSALLRWTTASETNNAGFGIEHAESDGAFREVAFLAGHGTTAETHAYQHRLAALAPGRHRFRLRQVDTDGAAYRSGIVELTIDAVRTLVLAQSYPNPATTGAEIGFTVPATGDASLAVYDMLGREVARPFDGPAEAGRVYKARFEADGLSAGVYVYRLVHSGRTLTKTLTLVK